MNRPLSKRVIESDSEEDDEIPSKSARHDSGAEENGADSNGKKIL
jgi:hypothetical protein